MINSNMFNYVNVLSKAADATWKRNELLTNNIANASTPGYKRKDVEFQTLLMRQLQGNGSLNQKVANANLNALEPSVYTDYSNLSYRLDGNNVDIDSESANLAQNQIAHSALLESMTQEFSRIKTVLSSN